MLKQIFESLLPDNIKDIPLVKDAVEIFIQNLEERSEVSIQVRDIFNSDNTIVKENLFKIYLNSLYTIITSLQENQPILKKLEEAGRVNALLHKDIKEILNEEYFVTSKTFKQNKGTKLAVEYAYNLTKKIEGDETAEDLFKMIDIKPFHFRTEGSVMKEMYEAVVKPLSHPIGFTHTYQQLIRKSFQDLFGFKNIYDVTKLEVRCIDGYIDVYTSDKTDAAIRDEFIGKRSFILTGLPYTEAEFNTYVNTYTDKVIKEFNTRTEEIGTYVSVLFEDDTFLEQYPSPLKVYFRNYIDELENTDNYLKQYGDHCSLYVEYTQDFEFLYTDDLTTAVTLNLSVINDSGQAMKPSEIYYGIIGIDKCFAVGGDEYVWVNDGVDETHPDNLVDDTSTADYITKLIGQLRSGGYSLPDTLVSGLFTEGNDFDLDIDNIQNEEMFINISRSLFPTNSNEHYIMTNSGDVDEDFNIYQLTTGGNYLTTEEPEDIQAGVLDPADWDPSVTYSFGEYVTYNDVIYIAINTNDLDLDDNLNKQPDLYLSVDNTDINTSYWKIWEQPLNFAGFYIYSQSDSVYFRVSPDV